MGLHLPNEEFHTSDSIQGHLLTPSEIEDIFLLRPGKQPCKLEKEDALSLSSLLTNVRVQGSGTTSYTDYDGVYSKMFSIVYNDSTKIEFSASNPFYIVDSIGYKSEYSLCDAISNLYWEFCDKYYP